MTSQWFAGTVKEVQSGDTLVIIGDGSQANGLPPEKRLNLSAVDAPRMAWSHMCEFSQRELSARLDHAYGNRGRMQPRRDSISVSEELAWESREFLRRLCAGRKCMFRVDYKVESINREFGTVLLDIDGAKAAVEALRAAEDEAAAVGRGVHNSDIDAKANTRFSFDTDSAAVGSEYVAACGCKGVPVAAIVDAVLTGSTLKVVTLPDRVVVTIALCGAQAPTVRRNAEGGLDGDPLGVEARAFTERKVLSREVRIVMQGGDSGSRVHAEVVYVDDGKAASLAAALLQEGLAKFSDWSAKLLPIGKTVTCAASQLKKREIAAQDERRGLWRLTAPAPRDTERTGNKFEGRVVEILSGDTLLVTSPSGQETKLSLASIRAPRLRPQGASEPEPFAHEAKEFLRKHSIGESAMVTLEYSRKVQTTDPASLTSANPLTMQLGNVAVQTPRGAQQLAEMIVRRGFAAVQSSREGEERSSIFGALMTAEEFAKGKRAGIHGNKQPGSVRTNDVSAPGNAARAKQYLPFFQRHGSVPCVVEHVMSGSRLKLYVPRESVTIAFSPSGVKTPSRGGPARGTQAAQAAEPFGPEAYQFCREHFLQRDGVVTIEGCDKGGTFLGRLAVGSQDLSLGLLSAGLGSLHPLFSAERVSGGAALAAAQERAQSARKGMWHDFDPAARDSAAGAAGDGGGAAVAPDSAAPFTSVLVTNVASACRLYLQPQDEPRLAWVTRECAASAAASFDGWPSPPRSGAKVLARYAADGAWYRGYVERVVGTSADVYFLDFGNTELVPLSDSRPLDAALQAVAPLCYLAQLAYVKAPDLDSDWGQDAARELVQLVGGARKLAAKKVHVQRASGSHPQDAHGLAHVVLCDADEAKRELPGSINGQLLQAGFVRLPDISSVRHPAAKDAILQLMPCLESARRAHVGMYVYGDPGDSDDEYY